MYLADSGEDGAVSSIPESDVISVSASVYGSVLAAGLGDGMDLFFW